MMTPPLRSSFWSQSDKKLLSPVFFFHTHSATLSCSWASLLFPVMANRVCCRPWWYIPYVCRKEQWWMHRQAAEIQRCMKSLCIYNHSQRWRDLPLSYWWDPYMNDSDIVDIEWAVAGIGISCPTRAV
jgi:hypothetical protein